MSSDMPFESIELHQPLGPVENDASAHAVQRYCEDWSDPNPLYLERSPFGGPVVPPAFQAGLTGFRLLSTRYKTRATIGARSEHQSVQPAFVGSRLFTAGSVVDKYVRRGLEYVVVESETHDENRRLIRRSRDVILLSLERREEPGAASSSSPPATQPVERPSEGGTPIASIHKRAYQRALDESRFASNSIHNDAYTRKHGYAGALMSAYVLCGYMSELLVAHFGPSWLQGGWFGVTFINGGVQQGDAIILGGSVERVVQSPDGARQELAIWIDKGDGKRVVSGRATGGLREL